MKNYDPNTDEICQVAKTQPLPGLFEALYKKLSNVDRARLRQWIEEEHRAAADEQWEKDKDRIKDGD
jgi:hypothetical protein